MTIAYSLYENPLTQNPSDYAARVQPVGSADLETIIARITEHGGNFSDATIQAVLQEMIGTCERLLLEGYRVNLGGLCELFIRISGNFDGAGDHFDPARHRVDVGATPGSLVRGAVREHVKLHKTEAAKPAPLPLEYADTASGERNGALTPGNIGTVNGSRLHFNGDAADEGVFLIPAGKEKPDEKEKRREVRIPHLQKNKPSQLVFLNPADLPKGAYYVEVRARSRAGAELRIGRLEEVLMV